MKKLLLGSVALIALVSTASAADMAARPYTKAPPMVAAPVYSWTGCYIGGNLGAGWHRIDQTQIAKVNGLPIVPNNDFGGATSNGNFVGGGQIGCDYQFASNWVIGVQGMVNYGDVTSSHVVPTAFPGFPVGSFVDNTTTRYTVTATARLGYLFTPAVLGYVKGGAAFTRVDSTYTGLVPTPFLSESASSDRTGYTVGAGVEWMFAPGWSVFGEFNYADFGRRDISYVQGPTTVGLADVVSTRLTTSSAVAGINYKFNFGGPVVARY